MADLVPVADLAPGVPSRIVTISTVDITEGAPGEGHIDFILPADIHAPSVGVIVQAGVVRVNLDAGAGQVRLPAFDAGATDPDDWVIMVKKSWAPHPYPVRIPAGSTAISLAALPEVRRLSWAASTWLLTSASVRVVEGAVWGASVATVGGVAQFTFTVPPAGTAYWRGLLTADTDAAGLSAGVYVVPNAAVASSLGMPAASGGILTVSPHGTGTGVRTFQPWLTPEQWTSTRNSSTVWGPWVRTGGAANTPNLGKTDLDTVLTTGQWAQPNTGYATTDRNYPFQVRGFLQVFDGSGSHKFQVYYGSYTGRLAFREYYSGTWGPWHEPAADVEATLTARMDGLEAVVASSGSFNLGVHAHTVREADMRRRLGRVTTGGKAAVALVFDHGLDAFGSKVLPLLQARAMRATLAVNGSTFEPGYIYASTNGAATWETLQQWAAAGVEIANHGHTHHGRSGVTELSEEVKTSRETIEAGIGQPVDSWVQYGPISGDPDNDSFGMGSSSAAYYTTSMGRLLLDNHAVVTGSVSTPQPTYPLDGTIPVGMWGRWVDAGNNAAMSAITKMLDRAISRGERCLVRCHPAYLDQTSSDGTAYATTAFLERVLDAIAARSASLTVLPLREWAIANL